MADVLKRVTSQYAQSRHNICTMEQRNVRGAHLERQTYRPIADKKTPRFDANLRKAALQTRVFIFPRGFAALHHYSICVCSKTVEVNETCCSSITQAERITQRYSDPQCGIAFCLRPTAGFDRGQKGSRSKTTFQGR